MSIPNNPIARAVLGVGTLGGSEIARAGISIGKSLIGGKNVGDGLKRDMLKVGKPTKFGVADAFALAPGMGPLSQVPFAPGISPLAQAVNAEATQGQLDKLKPQQVPTFTSPAAHTALMPTSSPAATIRTRRNFSTLLTGAQGDKSSTPVVKNTLLGGSSGVLGR